MPNNQKKETMPTFKYDLAISASTESEADSKVQSLAVLASRLTAKELAKLAHIVKNEPVTLAIAKSKLGL